MIRNDTSPTSPGSPGTTSSTDLGPVQRLHQVELAKRWRISPRTLERWRVEGFGPAYLKIGGRVIYRLEDIEAYEKAQLHCPSATPIAVVTGGR